RGTVGATSPSTSDYYKIATWNARSLYKPGKLANIIKEMARMEVDVLGVSETCWKGDGEFETNLPDQEEVFKVIYSGGENNRQGVGIIIKKKTEGSILLPQMISERIMVIRLKPTPVNILIVQAYAPCEDSEEEEKE